MGLTATLVFATLVAGIGSGFQHGYNTGVVNAPQEVIEDWIGSVSKGDAEEADKTKVTLIWSFIVSVYCIGGVLGGLTSTLYSEYLGRKGGLIVNNIYAIIAAILMGFSKTAGSYILLIVGRFVTGYNCGLNSALAVTYLIEIAPQSMRGAIGSIYQLIITISILISQIMGMKSVLGTADLWPWLMFLVAFVAVLQAILLPLCCETPKYLFSKGKEDKAMKALQWLRKSDEEAQKDMALIKSDYEQEKAASEGAVKCSQLCSQKVLRNALLISVAVMLAQQLSGINAVIYYSTRTFKESGLSDEAAGYATIAMGAMNVLMTVISVILVEIAGRKTLLLFGFGSMFIDTVLLTLTMSINGKVWSYLSAVLVVLFVVCFATGPGSIPWFLVAEVFGDEARRHAASICMATNWFANFMVGLTFPTFQNLMSQYVFIIFAIFQLLFFIVIFFKVPETKNKTYEEVKKNFE